MFSIPKLKFFITNKKPLLINALFSYALQTLVIRLYLILILYKEQVNINLDFDIQMYIYFTSYFLYKYKELL